MKGLAKKIRTRSLQSSEIIPRPTSKETARRSPRPCRRLKMLPQHPIQLPPDHLSSVSSRASDQRNLTRRRQHAEQPARYSVHLGREDLLGSGRVIEEGVSWSEMVGRRLAGRG